MEIAKQFIAWRQAQTIQLTTRLWQFMAADINNPARTDMHWTDVRKCVGVLNDLRKLDTEVMKVLVTYSLPVPMVKPLFEPKVRPDPLLTIDWSILPDDFDDSQLTPNV